MTKKSLTKMHLSFILAAFIVSVAGVFAFCDYSDNEKEYFCWTGLGMFSGNVTYQIGGSGGPFPISKLQFPINVSIATFGNEFYLNKNFEIRGEITKNLTTYSGKMQDTDYSYVPAQPLLAYSSNDADVQTITTDIGFRYWAEQRNIKNLSLKFGLGFAMLYEHLEWRISNLNQTDYFDENGNLLVPPVQQTQPGLVLTYETTTSMPYLDLAAELENTDTFTLLLSVGYSPVAQVSEEDNHILRQIVATTNLIGSAYKLCLQAKYNLSKDWLLMGKWDWITFDLTGVENDFVYDGSGQNWTIEHETSTTQSVVSLSIARKF